MSSEEGIRLEEEEEETLLRTKPVVPKKLTVKNVGFFSVGFITLIYCLFELAVAVYIDSLTLLADCFHNLSDVVAIGIAYWASNAAKRGATERMSYGWARAEIIGGLTNGCFLLALSLYILLEAIPRFIEPVPLFPEGTGSSLAMVLFIAVAASGLAVNTVGTLIFAAVGVSHGHSHGGGGHGHSHGGSDHGHSHGDKKEKKDKHGHSHSEKKEKKDKHSHDEHDDHDDHAHGEKKKKDKHGHSHGEKKEKHGHSHSEKKKDKHGHSHSEKKKDKHGHDSKGKRKIDWNVFAVFIHYLGDAISSLFVLGLALLLKYYPEETWSDYADPASSILIVVIILVTTVPLIKSCSLVLMQSLPSQLNLADVRESLLQVDGVVYLHDLHAWQLVDGLVIASVHVGCEDGSDFNSISKAIKEVFHRHGIHSSSIQPEFVQRNSRMNADFCVENCVNDCEEEWCCKISADSHQNMQQKYSINAPV